LNKRVGLIATTPDSHAQWLNLQEFVLRAFTVGGGREIVRQQFTFSPPTTAVEREDYAANLEGVTALALSIIPGIDGSDAVAALKEWRAA
jgi:hypothetical protein